MAGVLHGANSNAWEILLSKGSLNKKDAVFSSFKKELDAIINIIKKLNKPEGFEESESITKLSNSLFCLWNKYGAELPADYITDRILEVADTLYQQRLYGMARAHGYRRCLLDKGIRSMEGEKEEEEEERKGGAWRNLTEFHTSCEDEKTIISIMRSEIGDTMCQYFLSKSSDPHLMYHTTQKASMAALSRLQTVSQLALLRESRYWLAYNAFALIYGISRDMMSASLVAPVLEYLLWCAVGMETSVPLISVKYLPLRTNFYVAACESYYHLHHPVHAEEFARRALEKVQELALMHYQANATRDPKADAILKESTIKLGVLIFRRTVFETRRKTKVIFRTRLRQSIKDFLQSTAPRSPTEKLLLEMFPGDSARFMAILGTLAPTNWRMLQPWTPPFISDLDSELLSDIYQELFYTGFDICIKSLYNQTSADITVPLVRHAVEGRSHVPLREILTFVSLSHTYQQKEVTDILMTKVIRVAQSCPVDLIQRRGNLFRLQVLTEQLQMAHKKCSSSSQSKQGNASQTLPSTKRTKSTHGNAAHPTSTPQKKPPSTTHGKGGDEVATLPVASRQSALASPRGSVMVGGGSPKHLGGDLHSEGKGGGRRGGGGRGGEEKVGERNNSILWKAHDASAGGKERSVQGSPTHGYGSITQLTSEDIKNMTPEEVYAMMLQVVHHLQGTLQTNPSLLQTDPDLLLDSFLVCLDIAGPSFEGIDAHDYHTCKAYLHGKESTKEMDLLMQLVWIANTLSLWQVDPLLHGRLMLKLCCLYEARAEPREVLLSADPDALFLTYSRTLLLHCEEECSKSLEYIKRSRRGHSFAGDFRHSPGSRSDGEGGGGERLYRRHLEELHAEFEYMRLRLKVKLATTIPPPPVSAAGGKASMLESKVKERELKKESRELLLSQLTSPSVAVADFGQLRADCVRNKYQLALLFILEATIRPDLSQVEKMNKIQDAYQCLTPEKARHDDSTQKHGGLAGIHKTSAPGRSYGTNGGSGGGGLLAPVLVHCTDTTMEFKPQPLNDGAKEMGVAYYYKLFGRLAAGSNVKVRTSDCSYPGLGLEVSAEAGCRLCVRGLQPNQEYMFAVVGYTKGGKPLASGIGTTSRPYLAAHSLPIDTAWGYCCQCAFAVGAEDILKKIGRSLWEHFVNRRPRDTNAGNRDGDQPPQQLHFELNRTIASSSTSSHLKHFVYSILANTHYAIKNGGYLVDQLSLRRTDSKKGGGTEGGTNDSVEKWSGGLRANHAHRLRLVRRLLVALEGCGMLNEGGLCLQVVVQVYGLLAPLLQHQLPGRDLLRLLLHCHAVLVELPEGVLLHTLSSVTYSIHHLMAVAMYHVGKMLVSKGNKTLFTTFCNCAKPLLLQTMPAAIRAITQDDSTDKEKEDHESVATSRSPAHQSGTPTSHEPLGSHASVLPVAAMAQKNVSTKKKKKPKKTLFIMDSIPDEQKTLHFKAVEAFLISRQHGINIMDELDLYGGEDPVILHAIITGQPHIQAYRELVKFKRRPQFLEMMVHFVTTAIGRGHAEKSVEWLLDAFQWLRKRNESLLASSLTRSNVTSLQAQRVHANRPKSSNTKAKAMGSGTAATVATPSTAGTAKVVRKSLSGPMAKEPNAQRLNVVLKAPTSISHDSFAPKANASLPAAVTTSVMAASRMRVSVPAHCSRTALKKAQWLAVRTSGLTPHVKITKDDLEVKAVYVLMSVLPELWHKYKARKRLRDVCGEEHCWRAQANLLLSYCYLHQALGRLKAESGEDVQGRQGDGGEEEEEEEEEEEKGRGGDREFRFDQSGVILEGVIPVFTPCVAGKGNKPISAHKLSAAVAAHSAGCSASSRASPSRLPSLAPPTQILVLENVQSCMKHFLQAAVLSMRGNHWVLLQNVGRALVNAINLLVHTLADFDVSSAHIILAGIYGLSTRPLYVLADGLVDLLSLTHRGEQYPQTSSLHLGSPLDTSNEVGVALVKQLVFLAVHTLYVHQHWEKVLSLALRFDDITSHSWGDQLVPVIKLVQARLTSRVEREKKKTTIEEKLDPAAHLDPGPKGYNVYGVVGHSLFTVPAKYLEEDLTQGRGMVNEQKRRSGGAVDCRAKCQKDLVHSRTFFQRYIAGIKRPHLVKGECNLLDILEGSVCVKKVGVSALSRAQLGSIMELYDKIVPELESCGLHELHCQAINELGDMYILSGNIRLAAKWWCEGVACLLKTKDPLANWRSVDSGTMLSGCGLWGCLLGAWMTAKLLKYVYWQQLDVRLECALLTASFLKAALTFSSHLPTSDLAYATFEPNPFKSVGGVKPFPGVDLFGDVFRCSPSSLVASLRWCCQELVHRGHALKALPVLWFYQYVAAMMCRAVKETVYSKNLRLRNFTQFPFFGLAIRQLNELLIGGGLPQEASPVQRPPEANWALPNFHDHLPLSDSGNLKVLSVLMEKSLRPVLVSLYGHLNVSELVIARGQLYTSMAATCPPTHMTNGFSGWTNADSCYCKTSDSEQLQTDILPHPHHSSSPQAQHLCQPGQCASPHSSTTCPTSMVRLPLSSQKRAVNISQNLLRHCEQDLGVLGRELEDLYNAGQHHGEELLELRVEVLLALARAAKTLLHSKTAYQLSLQALRLIQSAENSTTTWKGTKAVLSSCDLRLWLESRCWVVRSVVELSHPPSGAELLPGGGGEVDEGIVREACRECTRLGEVEVMAEMHMSVAEHALSSLPCQVPAALSHSQICIQQLSRLSELSYRGSLLLSRASLLLADVTCVQGTHSIPAPARTGSSNPKSATTTTTRHVVGEEMLAVFEGLTSSLQRQLESVSSSAHLNAHLPQRPLLASCLLRLAHTRLLLATRTDLSRTDLSRTNISKTGTKRDLGKTDSIRTDLPGRSQHLEAGMESCRHALELINDSALSDPCLVAELKSTYGFLLSGCEEESMQKECLEQLTVAGKMVADNAVDHRLAHTVLLKLADLHSGAAKKLFSDDMSSLPVATPASGVRVPSPKISLSAAANSTEARRSSKTREPDWDRQKKRSTYLSWAMVKTALQTSACQQLLKRLTSEAHQETVTKTIDRRSLQAMPDFAAMELCHATDGDERSEDIACCLADSVTVIPVERLLPRNQVVQGVWSLTWIKVLNYFYRLLQRCLWQKTSLDVSGSDWGLHYHAATPSLYVKARAMYTFLSAHCVPFKECLFPPVPLYVIQQASHTHKLVSQNPSSLEQHLVAGECELVMDWQQRSHTLLIHGREEDQVVGFFAFNVRPLHVPLQVAYHTTGVEVFVIHTTLAELAQLRRQWADLAEGSHAYLQMKESSMYRPMSGRSPKRSPKRKKNAQPPEELLKQMADGVANMARVFRVTKKELPKLEPQVVDQLCGVLEPYGSLSFKNSSAYQFLWDLMATGSVPKSGRLTLQVFPHLIHQQSRLATYTGKSN